MVGSLFAMATSRGVPSRPKHTRLLCTVLLPLSLFSLSVAIFRALLYPHIGDVYTPKRQFIAVIACSKSLRSWSTVQDSGLAKLLLPSLEKTFLLRESIVFKLEVIVAYDQGDTFWEESGHRLEVIEKSHVRVNFISVKRESKRIPFNEAARAASDYGADFIVRVNDDTEFLTEGWVSLGVQALSNMNPPNVGVVGPKCDQGNIEILTHDMVHSSHLLIFSEYYPIEFDNWWVDDWISHVYGSERTKKILDWEVKHHTSLHGQRYEVDYAQQKQLDESVVKGKERIAIFLEQRRQENPQNPMRIANELHL